MNQETFTQQINAAQERFRQIRAKTKQYPNSKDELLEGLLLELSIALEELHVATEEIHAQNESLLGAHQSLEAEQRRYHELFDLAPDAYIVTNTSGIIQEANQAASYLLQRQQKYLLGKPIAVLVAEGDRASFRETLSSLGELQTLRNWEVNLQPLQYSDPFPCEIAVSAARSGENTVIGFRWLIRDVTVQKQAEVELRRVLKHEQELNSWKSRIINTVAHEYRAPLNIIALAANILKDFNSKTTEAQKLKFLQKIQVSVNHLINLVDETLTHTHVGTEYLPFHPKLCNLERFCQELGATFQRMMDEHHTLELDIPNNCQEVWLDTELLKQILNNLLGNAIKYSPNGGTVWLKLTCQNEWAIFQVQDEGIGILQEDQEQLFEPFHRGKNTITIPGSGMGLAIAKKAIDLHQGNIAINSNVGVGTTIQVSLPLNLPERQGVMDEKTSC